MIIEEDIYRSIKAIIHFLKEDDNVNIPLLLKLDWKKKLLWIGYSTRKNEFVSESSLIDIKLTKEVFVHNLLFEIQKHLIVHSSWTLSVRDLNDSDKILFETKCCQSLRERVMQCLNKKMCNVFDVKIDQNGCNAEICFFIKDSPTEDNNNMICTAGYFNPVATNEMVLKILSHERCANIMETVGFIGVITSDRESKYNKCISKAFEMLAKHIKESDRESKHVIQMTETDIKTEISRDNKKATVPQPVTQFSATGRVLRERKAPLATVDLTSNDEDETDLDDSGLFYEIACSDIVQVVIEENEDLIYARGWDEQFGLDNPSSVNGDSELLEKFLDNLEMCQPDRENIETWDSLEEPRIDPEDSRFFDSAHVSSQSSFVDGLFHEMNESFENLSSNATRVIIDNDSKRVVEKTFSKKINQPSHLTSTPKLGRGLKYGETVKLNGSVRSVKSNLFSKDEIEAYVKKHPESADRFGLAIPNIDSFKSGYTIPKKSCDNLDPEPGPSSSVVEKSPHRISGRPPINRTLKNRPMSRGRKMVDMLGLLNKPLDGSNTPDRYKPKRAFQTLQVPSSIADVIDEPTVILSDDDDEPTQNTENNDLNNNGDEKPSRKRKLLPFSSDNQKRNRFFTTKPRKHSKPNFDNHDGR